MLKPDAAQFLITFEYDQSKAAGPPFSVLAEEVWSYWPQLQQVTSFDVIDLTPPKFRDAGLTEVIEAVWVSAS